jgi:hypothetical protein
LIRQCLLLVRAGFLYVPKPHFFSNQKAFGK